MADVRRFVEMGMVPGLAKEVAKQIDDAAGGGPVSSDDVTVDAFTGGGVTFAGGTLTAALQAIADATT